MADYSGMVSFGILRPHEVFTISPSQHPGPPSVVGCTLTTDRNEIPSLLESYCASGMAPERSRERRSRRSAPYHRRRAPFEQDQYGNRHERPITGSYFPRPQSTHAAQSGPSANTSTGRAGATTSRDENLGDDDENSQQSTQIQRFPVSDVPNLVVVERATVLYSPAPFSTKPKLSVLDISFGKTVKTNFCARIEGPHGFWVGKFTHKELGGQLAELVKRTGSAERYCAHGFLDSISSDMTMDPIRGRYTFMPGQTTGVIMWPNLPGNPELDIDLKELVELVGGCWNV
ncbi:hypothetical protein NCS52_01208700 [Fusarium sp. LHS14.1]|nr:hypothetical protein NCS52_01208700 [Fusarium sp. LHS14.1]